MPDSLFVMIKTTHERQKQGTLVAYNDNAAVIEGQLGCWFLPDPISGEFIRTPEPLHILCKVETHNHPTGISPFPGAATGSGGEIRDEGATGRGGKPKAGITGFSVSDLRLPGLSMPWDLPNMPNPRDSAVTRPPVPVRPVSPPKSTASEQGCRCNAVDDIETPAGFCLNTQNQSVWKPAPTAPVSSEAAGSSQCTRTIFPHS